LFEFKKFVSWESEGSVNFGLNESLFDFLFEFDEFLFNSFINVPWSFERSAGKANVVAASELSFD